MIIIGIDTGGTFTDFIYKKGEKWGVYKTLSTPSNPAEAVLKGITYITDGAPANIIHGTTVATNAILERKGVKTAIIANKGFEDIIEIGRQNRKELYNLKYKRGEHLVPPSLRFSINCRINADGDEIIPLNFNELDSVISKLKSSETEAVAVSFLFSFLNDKHEKYIGKILEKEGIFVCISSEIMPEFREYERLSTTVVNAYVSPIMDRYLTFIKDNIKDSKFSVMQSNGGIISADTAIKQSVRTILSGPAGGAVGAFEIAKMSGFDKIITFDMGGTSTDVSLINGALSMSVESEIDGFPVKVPMIDINTVGAGGGSIAFKDSGGALRVGPRSAGAFPGPICYGKGEEITVTDANLFLGRLSPEHFLGGNIKLKKGRLDKYFKELSRIFNLSEVELPEGILEIANSNMEKAIRKISIEKGYNPSEFTLFSFGGAGGLHAAFLAQLLDIPKILVPKNPGILSAMGMILSDIVKDYSKTVMIKEHLEYEKILTLYKEIIQKGFQEMLKEGVLKKHISYNLMADLRYQGQSFEIVVDFDERFLENFHIKHEKYYGYANRDKKVELVNIRVRFTGKTEKPEFIPSKKRITDIDNRAVLKEDLVIFKGKPEKTIFYERDKLKYGNRFTGPAIVVEYSSTTVIPPDFTVEIDKFENMIISLPEKEL